MRAYNMLDDLFKTDNLVMDQKKQNINFPAP